MKSATTKKILIVIENLVTLRSIMPVMNELNKRDQYFKILSHPKYFDKVNDIFDNSKMVQRTDAQNEDWSIVLGSNPKHKNIYSGKVATVFHGSLFGNSSFSLKRAITSDLYFGMTPNEINYIKRHAGSEFSVEKFIPTGNARTDAIHHINTMSTDLKKNIRSKNFEKIKFEPLKKTVLITSHWTSNSNHRIFGPLLALEIVRNIEDVQVIITGHPRLWENPQYEFFPNQRVETAGFSSMNLLMQFEKIKNNPNISIQFAADPINLLALTDVCVADYSSILAESIYLNIPTISRVEGNFFDREIQNIVSQATEQFVDVNTAIHAIKSYLRNPELHAVERKNMREFFLYNLGSSTKKICDELQNFL